MRWVPWALAGFGVVQYAVFAFTKPENYVTLDTAYLVMALSLIAALVTWAFSCWGCDWGGCGCDCCEGCSGDDCCGRCACCADDGHGHEHGHEGHDHPH